MNEKRYYVVECVGCIAIKDRNKATEYEGGGTHPDNDDVVKYWAGKQVEKKCKTCGHTSFSRWETDPSDRKEAHKLCKELNAKE